PGITRKEILGEFPGYVLPQTITDAGWYNATRSYEELYTSAGRAIKGVLVLRRRATEDAELKNARIAIVTHGTFCGNDHLNQNQSRIKILVLDQVRLKAQDACAPPQKNFNLVDRMDYSR
ncbi:MAG: hypothetical protein ABI700_13455, partial [Chloroflexota bacterium]